MIIFKFVARDTILYNNEKLRGYDFNDMVIVPVRYIGDIRSEMQKYIDKFEKLGLEFNVSHVGKVIRIEI